MNFEISIVLILLILLIYIILINIFTVWLRTTGVPDDVARFQGISLFTNCGFTTGESEAIATSRTRRKIAIICMVVGNFFSVVIISLIVNVFSHFNNRQSEDALVFSLVAVGIFVAVLLILQIPVVKNAYSSFIEAMIDARVEKSNHDNVIFIVEHFAGKSVVEVHIHWIPEMLYGKTIHESKLKGDYGINVLSIKRNKKNIEITRNTVIQKNDRILVYGTYAAVKEVFSIAAERERIEAKEALNHIKRFNELDLIDNYAHHALVEVKVQAVPEFLKGKTLFHSGLKSKFGINVMFIRRGKNVVEINKDTIIEKGDLLVVFGDFTAIKNVFIFEEDR